MKILKEIVILFLFCCLPFFLTGCSTLSYEGDDYNVQNTQTIKTNEDFVFDAYKKSINDVNIKMGISKTQIPEILVLMVQIENYSYDNPYVFQVSDLEVYNPHKKVQFISANSFLNVYQNQEAETISQMGMMSSTFTNLSGMASNYNDLNQAVLQNNAQKTNQDAFDKIDKIGKQILSHSIRTSSTISPRKSQYFYFFFEDDDEFPISIEYKNLNYKFNL